MTTLTQAAFARHLGVVKSYITLLKQQGRLVMTDDGKVDVEASEAKIKATEDPGKTAVAERHSKNREAGQGTAATTEATAGPRVDGQKAAKTEDDEPPTEPGTPDYQKARARKETANADLAEMEARSRAGQLMETAAVVAAVADAGTTLRTALQTLPGIIAPQLATMADENQIRLLLEDHIEQALGELTSRLAGVAKEAA